MGVFNVVVIEDSEIEMGLLSHIVENIENVKLFAFSTGFEALIFLNAQHDFGIDLVLSDWQLPDLDGLSILKSFREKYPTQPFYMVTAHTSVFLVQESKRAKASGFISKPYVAADVVALIEKWQKKAQNSDPV